MPFSTQLNEMLLNYTEEIYLEANDLGREKNGTWLI